MYRHREAEAALLSLMRQFKVVLVTGARQVGKTTMLQHLLPGDFRYVTLDDPRAGCSPGRTRRSSSTPTDFPWPLTRFSGFPGCFSRSSSSSISPPRWGASC